MTDPKTEDQRHADFLLAVELLGGQRATARLLDIAERTVRALVSRERNLHSGFMRDLTAALRNHASACTALARQTDPLFTANRTAAELEKANG
jgi:hypothetical protein